MGFHVPNDSNLTVSRWTIVRGIIKRSTGIIMFTLAMMMLLYFILALTLVRIVPGLAGGAGLVPVKNPVFYGERIPIAQENEKPSRVLIDTTNEHDGSILDNAKNSFMNNPNTAIVDVYAGPAGALKWEQPNILLVNDRAMPAPMPGVQKTTRNPQGSPINEKENLYQEYVGICVEGNCNEGEAVIFNYNQLIGIPL